MGRFGCVIFFTFDSEMRFFIYYGRTLVRVAQRWWVGVKNQPTVMGLFSISRNKSRDGDDFVG